MGIFIFGGRPITDEELNLSAPDISEAKNLARHVERCSSRYRLFVRRMADQGADLQQIKLALFVIGGYLIIVSEPARNVIGAFLKLVGG